jgi:drug/metabolite transporter (DMT)-like permease
MNKISAVWKGYLFAFLATIAVSNVYIFGKAGLNEVHLSLFGVYWFGIAIISNLIYSFLSGRFRKFKNLELAHFKPLTGIGIVEVVATVSMFIAIDKILNPAVPAFLRNLEPIFIVLLGIFFLKEKYSGIEKMGIFLTVFGAVIISYKSEAGFSSLFIDGAQYMFVACVFYAIRTVWVKLVVHKIDPIVLNLNKVVFLFVAFFIYYIVSDLPFQISKVAFFNILIGAIIGPFFTSYAQYLSLHYIDASRSTLIQSTAGVFTLFFAYIYFGSLPFLYQVIGGIVTIIGIWILIDGKRIINLKMK